jgi:hypothetical protein
MFMKKIIIVGLAIFITSVNIAFSQNIFKTNDVYIELLGNGVLGSINYERQLSKQPGFGVRFGVGTVYDNPQPTIKEEFLMTYIIGINYLFKLKDGKSFVDAGLGFTITPTELYFLAPGDSRAENFVNFVPSFGYRRHTKNNRMWRISLTPIGVNTGFIPWLGASIGKRF